MWHVKVDQCFRRYVSEMLGKKLKFIHKLSDEERSGFLSSCPARKRLDLEHPSDLMDDSIDH
jgi:hypothetical protein